MKFPKHDASLRLDHNEHKSHYDEITQFIVDRDLMDDFESPADMQQAIDEDSIWVLQWYPKTPIGFCRIAAARLEQIFDRLEREFSFLENKRD